MDLDWTNVSTVVIGKALEELEELDITNVRAVDITRGVEWVK